MADLLPCPWCQTTDQLRLNGNPVLFVDCFRCGIEGPPGYTEEEARTRWNARTPNPRLTEARALLTECAAEVEARGVDPSLAAAVREWLGVGDG